MDNIHSDGTIDTPPFCISDDVAPDVSPLLREHIDTVLRNCTARDPSTIDIILFYRVSDSLVVGLGRHLECRVASRMEMSYHCPGDCVLLTFDAVVVVGNLEKWENCRKLAKN
ncbi:hypothetical protein GCK72_016802 [Caenorhabditis remanei]|uniref:Uncharacterized protein n=1 Tax=Caenorhabditis remanei TaxID=31234 RepID=A0A6A5G6G0_CAERE|nr:hypothetical protein GCK72_016802 [Caenorhabditis remanei]KAF1750255.1 hypothetical protein GCK72_016802 [Caenorhabditis remanei]